MLTSLSALQAKQLELDASRRKVEDSQLALKFAEANRELEHARTEAEANRRLERTALELADQLKRQLADQDEKRHKLRGELNAVVLQLQSDLIDRDMLISNLRGKVKEVVVGVNKNGDGLMKEAEKVELTPMDVGHVEPAMLEIPPHGTR